MEAAGAERAAEAEVREGGGEVGGVEGSGGRGEGGGSGGKGGGTFEVTRVAASMDVERDA